MKTWFVAAAAAVVAVSLTLAPVDADAKKRFGGGQSSGMQRDMPTRNAPDAPPAKPATPAPSGQPGTAAAPAAAGTAAAGAAAAATKKSWMGPIAGLAAGLGLVALASALGFGEELANFLMLALLGVATLALVLWAVRRFGRKGAQPSVTPAYAGAAPSGAAAPTGLPTADTLTARTAEPVAGATQPSKPFVPAWPSAGSDASPADASPTAGAPIAFQRGNVPADFDTAGFERVARMIFIRMQAAHDAADLDDLRSFTTPEMFAAVKVDIQDRVAGTTQHTEVEHVDAEVLDVATEDGRQIVSVRFSGRIREDGESAEAFDEVWHLVKPVDGSRNWAIAGIQQQPMSV
jgi:predicted lipid-binding transport protein (Tim44 family)